MARYTDSTSVGILLSTSFTSSTDPTQAEVNTIASFVSKYIDTVTGRIWTTATTSEYFDTWSDSRQRWSGGSSWKDVQSSFFLKNYPIVSVQYVRENLAALGSGASWTTRATGYGGECMFYPGEGVVRFHRSYPTAGYRNILIAYTYGETPTPDDIAYAAALLTAAQVITAIKRASDQEGLSSVSIGDASYNFGDIDAQKKEFEMRGNAILKERGFTAHMEFR